MSFSTLKTLFAIVALVGLASADDLTCLTADERAESVLYSQLQHEAYTLLEGRAQRVERLTTKAQIAAHQQQLREFFIQQLGGLPERTALNSRTIRTIQCEGYRIECVLFESQPNHHVTANLYLPDADSTVPGVVVSSGHSRTAKIADYNQRFGIMLARHGMAALCFDPIGQGERSQILDEEGRPRFNSTTTEHFLVGVGSTLVGRSTARYRVWDAIRAIDYLCGRDEVDSARIGMTGCSGGGTLTSYVMALDDRVACAAPACYLTTFRRLIETIGPQDAEQNIYGQIAFGLDHPDYVILRAPKPTLISSTTNDFFDIRGSWETFRQCKRLYTRLGYPERVDLVEAEGDHGVQPQNLAAITQWMQRWLLQRDAHVIVPPAIPLLARQDLLCTDTGQVLDLPDERSVFDLNAAYEADLAKQREMLWETTSPEELTTRIRSLLQLPAGERIAPRWSDLGRVRRDGYHIDKLILKSDVDALIPALTFHPASPDDAAYLYVHDDGKLGAAQPDGHIERLVDEGYAVVSLDLRGQGETSAGRGDPLLSDWKTYYLAYLLGKPLLGLRVHDLLAAADFVAHYEKEMGQRRDVHLVGEGQAGIVALHAAALDPELFTSVTLRNTPRSWSLMVEDRIPTKQLDSVVHGALQLYDLPDLVRLAGADKVRME